MKYLFFLLAVSCAHNVHYERPGRHPAYLHALTDLRTARAHVEKRGGDPEMRWDESVAIHEIDEAINEIKRAAIDDGKNLNDHPPVDAHGDRAGRLHRAVELLRKSRNDLMREEDNGYADGLRDRAIRHIDAALNYVEQGIANAHY